MLPLLLALTACSRPDTDGPADTTPGDTADSSADSGGDSGDSADSGIDTAETGDSGGDTGEPGLQFTDISPADAPPECEGRLLWARRSEQINWGSARLDLDLPAGRAFQLVAQTTDDALLYVDSLEDPGSGTALDGNDWWYGDQTYTMGIWPQSADVVLNWPVHGDDTPMSAGTWSPKLAAIDADYQWARDVPLDLDLYVNVDDDLDHGCFFVRVLTARGVSEDTARVAQLQRAVVRMQEIWAQHGLTVVVEWGEAALDADLPAPGTGDPAYAELAAEAAPYQLLLVIGEFIGGDTTGRLGQAGNVPGALAPTDRSAVTIAWMMHAGADGVLSDDETTMMGESMAHELGHYLGLFHPIEFDESWYTVYFDSLEDTPTCEAWADCTASLGANLMFPIAWCAWDSSCDAMDDITDQQRAVVQRYAGVL